MSKIVTYLCEKNNFLREGIKSFLSESDFKIVVEFEEAIDLQGFNEEVTPELIILGIHDRNECLVIEDEINAIKKEFPKTRLVLLITQEDFLSFPDLCSLNVDGYISRDIIKRAFLDYLDLIIIGERIAPSFMIDRLAGKSAGGANHVKLLEKNLSTRELDIIKLLREGCSNKLIARNLDIAESTVKVHLKSLLRKLGMKNRTQVAIWSMDKNFGNTY